MKYLIKLGEVSSVGLAGIAIYLLVQQFGIIKPFCQCETPVYLDSLKVTDIAPSPETKPRK